MIEETDVSNGNSKVVYIKKYTKGIFRGLEGEGSEASRNCMVKYII